MATDDIEQQSAADEDQPEEEPVPVGIARIRDEWRASGLVEEVPEADREAEPVVFPEAEEGAGVGDYTLDMEEVRERLPLANEAVDRLIASGELDSVLVRAPDGEPRRLVSQSSFERFEQDSAIDPDAMARAAKKMADRSLAAAVEELRLAVEELRSSQGRLLQQMKDILLLEVRNLKEQDRDLTSFVFELAEEIRRVMPRKRR
jgi:hypothetical protein